MILYSVHISSLQSKQLRQLAKRGSAQSAAVSEQDTPLERLSEPSPKDGGHYSSLKNADESKSVPSVLAALHGKDSNYDVRSHSMPSTISNPESTGTALPWKADLVLVPFS
jgi:hypothetical protein